MLGKIRFLAVGFLMLLTFALISEVGASPPQSSPTKNSYCKNPVAFTAVSANQDVKLQAQSQYSLDERISDFITAPSDLAKTSAKLATEALNYIQLRERPGWQMTEALTAYNTQLSNTAFSQSKHQERRRCRIDNQKVTNHIRASIT